MTQPVKAEQQALARQFGQLHRSSRLLVLPNAWDAGSAVIFERVGFNAVGTTSAGIAYSLGYPDGERVEFADVLECVKRILKRITVPLTVDMERGYGNEVEQVVENVRRVIALGAVGINLEDGLASPSPRLTEQVEQCDLLQAVAALKKELGLPFIINARTDVYWLGIGDPARRLNLALERAGAYAAAGADCVFIPGKLNRETIQALTTELAVPLNVIAAPDSLSVSELESLGVARLSLGSGPVRATLGLTHTIANELKHGSFESLNQNVLPYVAANALFT